MSAWPSDSELSAMTAAELRAVLADLRLSQCCHCKQSPFPATQSTCAPPESSFQGSASASVSSAAAGIDTAMLVDNSLDSAANADPPVPSGNAWLAAASTPTKRLRNAVNRNSQQKPFDFSRYRFRNIALQITYYGSEYNGFAAQNHSNSTESKESARHNQSDATNGPVDIENEEGGKDEEEQMNPSKRHKAAPGSSSSSVVEPLSVESVFFSALQLTKLIVDRAHSHYARCGRTDRGVHALGQVVALWLRSSQSVGDSTERMGLVPMELSHDRWKADHKDNGAATTDANDDDDDECSTADSAASSSSSSSSFPALSDESQEIDYLYLLNRVLPLSIRVSAWCPVPVTFSARFSCLSRSYRYVFFQDGMDVSAMNTAAAALKGNHSFHNFCKVDLSGQTHARRTILDAEVRVADDEYTQLIAAEEVKHSGASPQPAFSPLSLHPDRWCDFFVRGNAFLYHQVRCLVAILFMVGRGHESPAIVSSLLSDSDFPRKPVYDLASENSLILREAGYLPSLLDFSAPAASSRAAAEREVRNARRTLADMHGMWRKARTTERVWQIFVHSAKERLESLERKLEEWRQKESNEGRQQHGKAAKKEQYTPLFTHRHSLVSSHVSSSSVTDASTSASSLSLSTSPHCFPFCPVVGLQQQLRPERAVSHQPLRLRVVEKSLADKASALTGKKKERRDRLVYYTEIWANERRQKKQAQGDGHGKSEMKSENDSDDRQPKMDQDK